MQIGIFFDSIKVIPEMGGIAWIKSPKSQNLSQSPPIPPNPLVEGINRTSPKLNGGYIT
jgi:hypothetical protein